MVTKLFIETIADMYENGELDKICNMKYYKLYKLMGVNRFYIARERRKARAFKKSLDELVKQGADLRKVPFIPINARIDSVEVYKNALCIMAGKEARDTEES